MGQGALLGDRQSKGNKQGAGRVCKWEDNTLVGLETQFYSVMSGNSHGGSFLFIQLEFSAFGIVLSCFTWKKWKAPASCLLIISCSFIQKLVLVWQSLGIQRRMKCIPIFKELTVQWRAGWGRQETKMQSEKHCQVAVCSGKIRQEGVISFLT